MAVLAQITLDQPFVPLDVTGDVAAIVQLDQLTLDSPPGDVQLDQSFNDLAVLVQPRLQLEGLPVGATVGPPPIVTSSWTVNGVDPGAILIGPTTVGADLTSCARTWEQAVQASTGSRAKGDFLVGPLGYEITVGGIVPGRGVPVSFEVQLDGEPIALLTNGYGEDSPREWNGKIHTMVLSGSGPEVLWRDVEVDLELLPDHGLTQGEICILAMETAGIPDAQIGVDPQLGSPRTLPQNERCTPLWPLIKKILEPIGHTIMAGRSDDVFRAVNLEIGDASPVLLIDERDITIEGGVAIGLDGQAPTCFDVEARRIEDSATGTGTGTVTVQIVIESFVENFIGRVPVATQDGAGNISATGLGPPPPVAKELVSETTVRVTTEDGCEVLVYTRVKEFFNPPKARYEAVASVDGLPRGYPGGTVFFFQGSPPVKDDADEGFQWSRDRFVITSEVFEEPQYDDDGRRTGTKTRHNGWRNIAAADKNRTGPGSAWELENYEPGPWSAGLARLLFAEDRYFIGPGAPDALFPSGTSGLYPGIFVVLRHTKVEDRVNEIDECDQIPSTEITLTEYGLRTGTTQLYATGNVHRTDTEVGVTSSEKELSTTINNRTKVINTGTDIEGRSTATRVKDAPAGAGLPAAEICTDEEVDRENEQTIEVRVCIERLDAGGQPVVDTTRPSSLTSRYVESIEEAIAWGQIALRIANGYEVAFVMASPAPIIDAGDVLQINFPELGFADRLAKVIVTDTEIAAVSAEGQEVNRHFVMVRVPPTG